ncbi:hypothetical protein FACS189468_1390 [Spirochaetia bacterium]|nr:hypothetical protein FACS189468_1390 [Spirochaetia bacterium]
MELLRIKKKHEVWGAAKILNIYGRNNPGKHVPVAGKGSPLFCFCGGAGTRSFGQAAKNEYNDVYTFIQPWVQKKAPGPAFSPYPCPPRSWYTQEPARG